MFNDEYTSIFPRPTEFSGISLFDINSTGNNEWERRGYPLLNAHYNVHYNIFPLFLQSLYVIRSKVPISKTTYQQSLNLFHFFYEGREGRVWSCNGNMQFFFYENYSRMKQRFYAAVSAHRRSRFLLMQIWCTWKGSIFFVPAHQGVCWVKIHFNKSNWQFEWPTLSFQ